MTNEESDFIKNAAEGTAKALKDKIPTLYPDLLQPATKELGKGLQSVIKLALTPITVSVWGYDKIADWLTHTLEKKLLEVPEKDIISPKASIVGPSIEAIRFLDDEIELREMYAQLIASSMNKETSQHVHPGYVELIRNMSYDDAIVLEHIYEKKDVVYFSILYIGKDEPLDIGKIPFISFMEIALTTKIKKPILNSIDNLQRLGIIKIHNLGQQDNPSFKKLFEKTIKSPFYKNQYQRTSIEFIETYSIDLSSFGASFCNSCLIKKE